MATQGKTLKHCPCHSASNRCALASQNERAKKHKVYNLQSLIPIDTCHTDSYRTSPATSSSNVTYWIPQQRRYVPTRPGKHRSNGCKTPTRPPPQHHRFHSNPSSNTWSLRSCWDRPPLPSKITETTSIRSVFKEMRHGQCQSKSGRSKPPAVNSSQICSQASAPSSPQRSLPAKLRSTTVLFDFKAVAKAWRPWNAFRGQNWCQE